MSAPAPPAQAERPHEAERPAAVGDWFGQPRGLTVLFLTDMWEQFSFYGMRALLVFYMTKALHFPQQSASMIYGFYAAGVFFTPIVGGVIADRWLGRRNAVVIGGTAMAAGHFMMAFPPLFYPALATIALGNGLFLPSLPGQIDSLYAHDDPRRRSAYNVFYVGINIGGLLAPLVAGTLGETLGWHWGFGCAGVGMLIGLVIYVSGGRYLPADQPIGRRASAAVGGADAGWSRKALVRRFAILFAIAGCVVVFRGAYEQLGNTFALWADGGVDRRVGNGFTIPATWFQSLNPAVVILATPFYVSRWNRQAARGREPSSLVKMATGAVLVAGAFLLIAGVSLWGHAAGAKPAWPWVALCCRAHDGGRALHPARRVGPIRPGGAAGAVRDRHRHVVLRRLLRQPPRWLDRRLLDGFGSRRLLCSDRGSGGRLRRPVARFFCDRSADGAGGLSALSGGYEKLVMVVKQFAEIF